MKRLLLLFILLTAASLPEVKAQWYLGGSLSWNAQLDRKDFAIDVLPEVGYSLGDWSFGTVVTLYWSRSDNSGEMSSYLNIGLAPYVEYYFYSTGPLSFFAEGGLDALYRASDPENRWRFVPYLAPGMEFRLADHWSMVAHLGRLEWDSVINSLAFNLFGNNLSLGLLYSF